MSLKELDCSMVGASEKLKSIYNSFESLRAEIKLIDDFLEEAQLCIDVLNDNIIKNKAVLRELRELKNGNPCGNVNIRFSVFDETGLLIDSSEDFEATNDVIKKAISRAEEYIKVDNTRISEWQNAMIEAQKAHDAHCIVLARAEAKLLARKYKLKKGQEIVYV